MRLLTTFGVLAAVVFTGFGLGTNPGRSAVPAHDRSQSVMTGRTASSRIVAQQGTVHILTVHAVDLAEGRQLLIEPSLRWRGRSKVVAQIERRGVSGSSVVASKVLNLPRGASKVAVPLSSRTVADLASCRPSRVVVSILGPRGQSVSGSANIVLDPPQCGRFFAPTSVWNTPLAPDAPLDPNSRAVTNSLLAQLHTQEARHYYPTINTTSYSIPIYTVPIEQPRVPVDLDNPASYDDALRAVLQAGVPIPAGAMPAAGLDGSMVIWQPGTDTMWEFERLALVSGQWHCADGGVINHASRSPGAFDGEGIVYGATGSGLALAGGLMTLREIESGHIDHALAFAIPLTRRSVWALPASRSDGYTVSPSAVPEGARFRLPASLNIAALHLPPFIAMMARAVQRYGMIVNNVSGNVSFYAQDPLPTGSNPYPKLFGGVQNIAAKFPFRDLELVKMDLQTYGHKAVPSVSAG